MTEKPDQGQRYFKVIRGSRTQAESTNATALPSYGESRHPAESFGKTQSDSVADPVAAAPVKTVNGVPISAMQHCCGRGCKHCRIYRHRMQS